MSERQISEKELHDLIQTLPIEEIFLIEFKKDNRWSKFLDFDGKNLTCNICNLKLFLPSLSAHCISAKHKDNLLKIQRLYHPKRTLPKNPNEKLSENAIKQLEEKSKQKAVQFNEEAERVLQYTMEKQIHKLCLTTTVKDPKHVYVNVGLPLNQLVLLEYLVKGEWKALLTAERLSQNSRFFCHLCNVYCGGVITVGAHFGGNSHMTMQLNTQAVRHKIHKQLTKNCRFNYNQVFCMSINGKGKKIYKERAEKLMEENTFLEELNDSDEVKLNVQNDKPASANLSTQSTSSKPKDSTANKTPAKSENISGRSEKSEKSTENKESKEGLIGVEYVVKLIRPQNGVIYECVLCESVCLESKMQSHLISHDHRLKYCDMHYSDTMKKYKDLIGHMRYNDFYCCVSPLLSKLASAIEKAHSRALPCTIKETEFMIERAEYVGQMYNVRHACQGHGPSFSKEVSKDDILEFKKNRHTYKESSTNPKTPCRFSVAPKVPYLGLFIYNLESRLDRAITKKTTMSACKLREHEKRSSRVLSKSPIKTLTSRGNKREHSPDSPTTQLWKQYDKEVALEKKRIDRKYDDYRKQPEDHPLYEQEWNRFWKQRRDELIAEGIDHRTYNYQAEWVHYFKNRLEELFCEAVRQVKDKVRTRLHMPLEPDTANQHQQKPSGDDARLYRKGPPSPKLARFAPDPFGLQQLQQQQQQLQQQFQQQLQQQLQQQRSVVLPVQPPNPFPVVAQVPDVSTVQNPGLAAVRITNSHNKPINISGDNRPNVINVLRLMTAMEDHLGSLGSKIMELFTKALQLEKKCNNNAQLLEKCLLTPEHCNLLEVAMEKLRGVLFAGLLEGNKANSFNKIIKCTDELLTYAEMRGWRNSSTEVSIPENRNSNNNASLDLHKLLNAIQNKNSAPASQQKSLSDTLKELMSGKAMKVQRTPEHSPRSFKEENYRNSSPPSYTYNGMDKEIKSTSSYSNNASDRDMKTNFNLSEIDMKSNFNKAGRDMKLSFNAHENQTSNLNRRQVNPEFGDSRNNERERNMSSLHNVQDNGRIMRSLNNSPPGKSAGEMRLINFNQYGNNNSSSHVPFHNMNMNNMPTVLDGMGYGGNSTQISKNMNTTPFNRRDGPPMLMQQFNRNTIGKSFPKRN